MSVDARFQLDRRFTRAITDPDSDAGRWALRKATQVETRAQLRAPVNQGRLRRSIHVTRPVRTANGIAFDVVADADYARWVHDGRRAGSRMPPRGAIADWARLHGIPASAVYPIQLAIATRGIEPRPFLLEALRDVFG